MARRTVTAADVPLIRHALRNKLTTVQDIMDQFGLSDGNVFFIANGTTWKEIPDPIPKGTWLPRRRWLDGSIPQSKTEPMPPADAAAARERRLASAAKSTRTRHKMRLKKARAERKGMLEKGDMPAEVSLKGAVRGKYAKKYAAQRDERRPLKTLNPPGALVHVNGNGKSRDPVRIIPGFDMLPPHIRTILSNEAELGMFRSIEGALFDTLERVRELRLTHSHKESVR